MNCGCCPLHPWVDAHHAKQEHGHPPWMETNQYANSCALTPLTPHNGGGTPSSADLIMNNPPSTSSETQPLHYEPDYQRTITFERLCGTLTFALRYDFVHRVLMIHVISCRSLVTHSSVCNPYVKMYLLPEHRHHCKTKIHKQTTNPDMNEVFSFDVPYKALAARMLRFTVFDFDRFSRHDLIGNCIMRDVFERSDLLNWTQYSMQIMGSNDKNDYGVLLLFVNYSRLDRVLVVTVAKAYNLRPMDITGASDPYVKIEQIHENRRIRKRKSTIKRANLNPVYHETLEFNIEEADLETTNLLVTVMDWDRIGSDDLLGCCVLGADSPTYEGREQWRAALSQHDHIDRNVDSAMLTSPTPRRHIQRSGKSRAVGKWHSLLADIPEQFRNYTKK